MTGPEHYKRAEEFLEGAESASKPERKAILLAYADVHATLALAAAVATSPSGAREATISSRVDRDSWRDACVEPDPPAPQRKVVVGR